MLYLLNGQDMPGLDQGSYGEVDESMDTYQIFKVIMKLKEKKSISQMSQLVSLKVGNTQYK